MMHLKTFSILWLFQVRCNAFFLRCAGHSCRPRLVVIVCKTECQDQTEERFPSQSHKIRDSQNCSPWIVLSGWLLGVAAAAVDAWWEQPQRQNSFFVGPDSSGIGQLLSDPVEHITCRVETIQCGQCAWQRRVVSVRCWVLAVIITPPSSVKLANFGFYFALHCTRHLHVLLITGDCRGCRIL